MKIADLEADHGPFGGPSDKDTNPFPSPASSHRSSPRESFDSDSSFHTSPRVFRDASPVNERRSKISRSTQRSSSQKVEPLSTPPSSPPNTNTRFTSSNTKARIGSPSPISQTTSPRPSPYVQRVPANTVQRILSGERHSATFEGTSQYAAGGTSACGLASMNAIRLAFELSSKISDSERLVTALVSEEFVRAAMGIATYWPNDMHLEVEPILQLPLFSSAIQALDDRYAECSYQTFSNAVVALRFDENSPGPRAVCVTRPPEVISVMHIPITRSTDNDRTPWLSTRRAESIYLVFDSHPRQNHPNGAAVHIFPSRRREDVAQYLMDLFQVDQEIINDPSLEWTAQLFGQLSYHLLAPLRVPEPLDEYALNMRILGADHKRNSAEEKLKTLEAEARVLRTQVLDKEQEVARLNLNAQRKQDEVQRLKTQLARAFRPPPKEQSGFSSWFLGRSQAGESPSTSSKHKGKGLEDSVGRLVNPAGREENGISLRYANNNRGGSGGSTSGGWGNAGGSKTSSNTRKSNTTNAEFSQWGRSSRPPTAQTSVSPKAVGSLARQRTASEEEEARSLEVAFRLQQQFDDETIQLSLAEALARSMEQPQFECRICMETCSDEDIAWVDGCEHSCCRECMRGDIQSKIEERRYPIPCPLCVAGAGGNHEQQHGIGTIPAWVVETIGISPELFNIYTEMQLAEHSIMIDCRGCSSSVFVDRSDHDCAETITCPMPGCTHKWCKQCNTTIESGSKHVCDGSAELERLMGEQGWKHCPGCRTPIERIIGCNHMTCRTPGCNMHFCYKCGEVVTDGGTRDEISAAVRKHYEACALFEVPPEV